MMETLRTLFQDYGAELVTAIGQHTAYVVVSVAIGFVVGLLAGILLSPGPPSPFQLHYSGALHFQTIPGPVFIGVLFIWWGQHLSHRHCGIERKKAYMHWGGSNDGVGRW